MRPAPKFQLDQLAYLTKHTGERVIVQIEGVEQHIRTGILYDVREVASRIGYHASESDMVRYDAKKHGTIAEAARMVS